MNHGFADTIRPHKLELIFTVLYDLSIKTQVHVLVIKCVDVTWAHGTVKVAFRCALQRYLNGTAGQDGLMPEVACRNAQAIPDFKSRAVHSFQPSQMKPSV